MGKLTERLPPSAVKHAPPGMHADGDGLYLQVGSAGARSWVYRFTLNGKTRYQGLGSADSISLKRARELAAEKRQLKAEGIDPLARKHEQQEALAKEIARAKTFEEVAKEYIAAHEAGWSNPKHRQQWRNTLSTYVYPKIGTTPIADIDVDHVLEVLTPIWNAKPETAGRVRGRIESILDFAKAKKLRSGENPALWRGHLDQLLAAKSDIRAVKHHAALPFAELPGFMGELAAKQSLSAAALEITILTALRTTEAIGARWEEIDFAAGIWTVPAERMKMGKEHRVPLSARALEVLRALAAHRRNEYVFPGIGGSAHISNMTMAKMLQLMNRGAVTVHGFRSSFRDWAAETTSYPNHVVEMALAHAIGDEVEKAYRRGDLFNKRRELMDEWATYCGSARGPAAVIPIRRGAHVSA